MLKFSLRSARIFFQNDEKQKSEEKSENKKEAEKEEEKTAKTEAWNFICAKNIFINIKKIYCAKYFSSFIMYK